MRVDFFIAGAPKCGTTALASYLEAHERICFSRPKEPHFFCPPLRPPGLEVQTVGEYHARFFPHFDEHIHQLVGAGTPQYLYYPEAIPAILDYNPQAKFIVMLRNPVDMVFSWHREMLRGLVEDVADVRTAWELQDRRAKGKSLPRHCRVPMVLQYRKVCMLGSQVERLLTLVDRRNVHFILMDDLRRKPREVYRDLCSFLGVDDDGKTDFPEVHPGIEWRSPGFMGLYNFVFGVKVKLMGHKPLPFSMDKRLKESLGFMKGSRRTAHDPEFVEMLRLAFADEIRKLSTLIDRDLSSWTAVGQAA